MQIGCHVSMAGGLDKAPQRAFELGCETFQIFTRSPHGGPALPITPAIAKNFKAEMKKYNMDQFVIHTPYFINFGSPKKNIYHGSISIVRGELDRGSLLGARYVMTHLGSFSGIEDEKVGIKQVSDGIKKILTGYKGETKLLLEIAAGSGQVVGSNFKQLAAIIKPLKKLKGFGGVCFDTQHAFASGYDIATVKGVEKTFKEFEKEIGLKLFCMSHMNDSKIPLAGKRDRHDHIGEGHIGTEGFKVLMKFFKKLEKQNKTIMPLILETEHDKVRADIEALKAIRDSK